MSSQTAVQNIRAQENSDGSKAPVQARNQRFTSAQVEDFPAVSGLENVWKFTPIQKIAGLLDGVLDGSDLAAETTASSGIVITTQKRSAANMGQAGLPEERGSANAWSQVADVLTVHISGDNQLATIHRSNLGSEPRAAHTIIESAPHSSGFVVLRHTGDAELSENVEVIVGDQSSLTVVTVQQWNESAKHLSSHFAKIGRDATLKHIVISLSGEVVRVNPSIHLTSQGGSIEALGAYFSSAGEHLEQQVYIDHEAAHTKSRVTYKGALHGEKARSVWIGDVLIRQSATGTDSYEQNRNLVLTDGTRADSIPNLEIETGDIAGAGHASATGRFDDEQLFYLMSRGLSEHDARKLVVRGFLLEVIQQIGNEDLEAELRSAIESEIDDSLVGAA